MDNITNQTDERTAARFGFRDTRPRKWEHIYSIKGGHRFFRDPETGRIAIADQSGDGSAIYGRVTIGWPHQTDDGVLWLDVTRPILFFKRYRSGGAHYSIPLLYPNGKSGQTIGNEAEAAYCAEAFGMTIKEGAAR
jgi:hypothetical protein